LLEIIFEYLVCHYFPISYGKEGMLNSTSLRKILQ